MKSPKSIVALIVLSMFAASVSFAADEKKEAVVSKEAPCCAKAEKAGKTCDHECCVAAAKEGKNCERCHGSGKIEKKEEEKKK